MRIKLIPLLLTLAVLAPAAVQAQVYTWKDARGTRHYSDAPPPNGVKYKRLKIKSDGPANPPEGADRAPNPAPQSSNPSSDDSQRNGKRMADTPTNRKAMCRQLQSNIALLKSKQAVNAAGPDGKLHAMSKKERAQQLHRESGQYQRYCKSTAAS